MSDLLQSQTQESCRLSLPDGLKDLMADISREVLRAQPQNLYKFIADYLSALLVTRENLSIAARICNDLCNSSCHPELDDELRYTIGLDEEDVEKAKIIIDKYFESGGAKEEILLSKLMKKTKINEKQLPAIQMAVRETFLRHQVNNIHTYGISDTTMANDVDEVTRAAHHTLRLYKQTEPLETEYNRMAQRVQDSYIAYGVSRRPHSEKIIKEAQSNTTSAGTSGKSICFEPNIAEPKRYNEQTLMTLFSTISDSCYFDNSNKPHLFQEQYSDSNELPDIVFNNHVSTRHDENILETTNYVNYVYEEKIKSDDMVKQEEILTTGEDEIVIEDQAIDTNDESDTSIDKMIQG